MLTFLTNTAAPVTDVVTDVVSNAATEATGFPGMDGVMEALPYMGYGMVGIFLVTGLIILAVTILNKTTSGK